MSKLHMSKMFKRFKNKPLYVVLFTMFVDMLGYGILIPVIPQLLGDQDSPYSVLPLGYSIEQGYILLGFLVGIYPLMQFVATPILGQLSDKYGRRKILAISLTGTCLSYLVFAYAILTRNIPLLFISRGFDGITGGNISVAQAAIADITTPEKRAKNFGLMGAAFGLGFIVGPYLGGKFSDQNLVSWFNASTPFWFAAILSFINVISVLLFFPETLKFMQRGVKIEWLRSIKNIIAAYGMKSVRVPFITSFLFQSGFTFFTTFFSIYLIRKFNFNQGNIGDFFAYIGICVVLSQAIVTRWLSKRYAEHQILKVSILAAGVLVAAHFIPQASWGLLLVTPLFATMIGLTQANLPSLVSRSVGPKIQGQILGVNSSVNTLAQALPPMLSGYIAALLTPNAPLIISACILGLAGIVFMTTYKPNYQKQ
ncbi:MAG: MFS transporter [bacterium]|nr:MFS transporter [bacterium]